MPTLRLIYLPEHQYQAFVTAEDETHNTTAELPTTFTRIHEKNTFPIDDATRNASSNNKKPPTVGEEKMEHQEQSDDHEEDDDYLDTLLQEAIDEVNRRSFSRHDAVRHQQVPHEEMVSSDEGVENDSSSSARLDAIQQKSGNKRKRTATTKSFDDRFNDLMAFKAKYGHCDVSQNGEDVSLGHWCTNMRGSYKKIQNNLKPKTKLSDEQIQRLSDAGFKWSLLPNATRLCFDDRFNDLMTFKAKYGHCDVSLIGGCENASLGNWCGVLRGSYKKIQNNLKPKMKLSDEKIQRLRDAGFKWLSQKEREIMSTKSFNECFNDLMTFKAKYGHCDVSQHGEDASLGHWCSALRGSYKKMQNNQKPTMKLSDEQIQRLSDTGFNWCLQKERAHVNESF